LLLACDVDGTLLERDGRPSDATRRAVAALQSRGVSVVLASGRMPSALMGLCRLLGLSGPQITMQGAHIASPLGGEIVATQTLSEEAVRAHLAFARQQAVPVLLYYPDRIRSEEHSSEIAALTVAFEEPIPEVVGDLRAFAASRPVKTFLVTGRARQAGVAAAARGDFGKRFAITWGDDRSVELLPAGVTKGAALQVLATSLGVELARVAAIGDGMNDLDMLRVAATSVAMGHARPEVRAAATLTLPQDVAEAFSLAISRLFPSLRVADPAASGTS
jgi:Cof subfamily protein (haloacid dehalogenase superfamily)